MSYSNPDLPNDNISSRTATNTIKYHRAEPIESPFISARAINSPHVVDDVLEEGQLVGLVQRQKCGGRSDLHARQKLVGVV